MCPVLRVQTGPRIQEGLKRPQLASAWTSRCGHLEQPQHRGVMAANLQDPDMLGWHIRTDASVPRLLEGQHPGPLAGAADLMRSSCLGPFQRNQVSVALVTPEHVIMFLGSFENMLTLL